MGDRLLVGENENLTNEVLRKFGYYSNRNLPRDPMETYLYEAVFYAIYTTIEDLNLDIKELKISDIPKHMTEDTIYKLWDVLGNGDRIRYEMIKDNVFRKVNEVIQSALPFCISTGGLTVSDLRKKIEDLPGDTPVFIERIEDVYFEKNGWKTEEIVFRRDDKGEVIEGTEVIKAQSSGGNNNRVIIYAHI